MAGQAPDDGPHEQLEGDERRHRVARQAEQQDRAPPAVDVRATERERLARLDGDAPQVHVADGVERRAGRRRTGRPTRRPTRRRCPPRRGRAGAAPRRPRAGRPRSRGRAARRRPRGRARGARGRSRPGSPPARASVPGGPHLVAGREHGDDRPAPHDDVGDARARTRAPRRPASPSPARRERRRSGRDVAARASGPRCPASTASWTRHAAAAGPAASRPRGPAPPVRVERRRELDRDHGVGARRHRGAGRDPDRASRP